MLNTLFLIGALLAAFQSPKVYAQGLDLTQAAVGCIMSGGSCLDNTGISFIDQFFGIGVDVPLYTRGQECYDLQNSWCYGNGGYWGSGFIKCREAKMAYYKQEAQRKGTWRPNSYPNAYDQEGEYFRELEKQLTKRGEDDYFTCTGKQREIYMKARCGIYYADWRLFPTKTVDCDDDD